ncbi:MAG: hypothetical protein KAG18_09100, partial [Sinobacterium sp.]|nr:hypothetical protein [Sinobacterium sp.]
MTDAENCLQAPLYIIGAELVSPAVLSVDHFHRQAYTLSNDKLFNAASTGITANQFSLDVIAEQVTKTLQQLALQSGINADRVLVLYRGDKLTALKKSLSGLSASLEFI